MLRHRKLPIIFLACAINLGGGMAQAASLAGCGDEQIACGEGEKCCEHKIATFCENQGCSSVRVEGQCLPLERSCDEFWCGNRQCQSNWLISKDVCCVYYQHGNTPDFACTASELNCPGNNARLSIRDTVASRTLQGE
jgi:hypothetical protein